MTRADRILEGLARFNADYKLVSGWRERGRPGTFNPRAIMLHGTASSSGSGDFPSYNIVTHSGVPGVPAPLYQILIGRHSGKARLIANGRANHAGMNNLAALQEAYKGNRLPHGYSPRGDNTGGNGTTLGISVENDNVGEELSPSVYSNLVVVTAAVCWALDIDADHILQHRHATKRKIDQGINIDDPRDAIQKVLDNDSGEVDEDMVDRGPVYVVVTGESPEDGRMRRWLINYRADHRRPLRNPEEDQYWTNVAKSSANPEVISGGRWGKERLAKYPLHPDHR